MILIPRCRLFYILRYLSKKPCNFHKSISFKTQVERKGLHLQKEIYESVNLNSVFFKKQENTTTGRTYEMKKKARSVLNLIKKC